MFINNGVPLYRWPSLFAVFLSVVSLICDQNLRFLKVFDIKSSFIYYFGIQYSFIIRGFRISGVLPERIYRKLRGLPVLDKNLMILCFCFQFLFINSERLESQTSTTCQWQAPSKVARSLYPKGLLNKIKKIQSNSYKLGFIEHSGTIRL